MADTYGASLSASASNSQTTGFKQDFRGIFGDNIAGGGVNRWLGPIVIIAVAVVAIVWLMRR